MEHSDVHLGEKDARSRNAARIIERDQRNQTLRLKFLDNGPPDLMRSCSVNVVVYGETVRTTEKSSEMAASRELTEETSLSDIETRPWSWTGQREILTPQVPQIMSVETLLQLGYAH